MLLKVLVFKAAAGASIRGAGCHQSNAGAALRDVSTAVSSNPESALLRWRMWAVKPSARMVAGETQPEERLRRGAEIHSAIRPESVPTMLVSWTDAPDAPLSPRGDERPGFVGS